MESNQSFYFCCDNTKPNICKRLFARTPKVERFIFAVRLQIFGLIQDTFLLSSRYCCCQYLFCLVFYGFEPLVSCIRRICNQCNFIFAVTKQKRNWYEWLVSIQHREYARHYHLCYTRILNGWLLKSMKTTIRILFGNELAGMIPILFMPEAKFHSDKFPTNKPGINGKEHRAGFARETLFFKFVLLL